MGLLNWTKKQVRKVRTAASKVSLIFSGSKNYARNQKKADEFINHFSKQSGQKVELTENARAELVRHLNNNPTVDDPKAKHLTNTTAKIVHYSKQNNGQIKQEHMIKALDIDVKLPSANFSPGHTPSGNNRSSQQGPSR